MFSQTRFLVSLQEAVKVESFRVCFACFLVYPMLVTSKNSCCCPSSENSSLPPRMTRVKSYVMRDDSSCGFEREGAILNVKPC